MGICALLCSPFSLSCESFALSELGRNILNVLCFRGFGCGIAYESPVFVGVSKGLEYLEVGGFYCMIPYILLQIMTVLL